LFRLFTDLVGYIAFCMAIQNQVLILHSTRTSAQPLVEYFTRRGDKVWLTEDATQAKNYLEARKPIFVLVDLHFPGNGGLELLTKIHQDHLPTQVIVTNQYPDLRREFLAKEQGFTVFLREPFTPTWIERALKKVEQALEGERVLVGKPEAIPRVRVSMRLKITLPYAVLALMFSLAAAFLVSRFVLETIHERFTSQLVDAAKLSADWMVNEESRLLKTLRTVANTSGVVQAVQNSDVMALRNLVLPTMINQQEEALEILDAQGIALLSIHHRAGGGMADYDTSQGSRAFQNIAFVQKSLLPPDAQDRDKYAGLVQVEGVDIFFISGPILDAHNQPVGVIMLGKTLSTLVRQNRQDTLAQINLYSLDGSLMATTMLIPESIQPLTPQFTLEVLARQDQQSNLRNLITNGNQSAILDIRDLFIASGKYAELLGPWEARAGEDLGVIGVALAESSLMQPTFTTRLQTFLIVSIAFIGVVIIGILVGNQITQPLKRVVQATIKVAAGNLEVKVPSTGNDEVAVLAHAFNYMVSGLQEGFIYRDILGRTVSPEVREALRTSFASGALRLEGQSTVGTVLMSDIRGFTTISEKAEPTTVLTWLNEYFGELVPVVTSYGGVVDKFEGDAMLTFFGILPKILPPEESAFNACQAAVEMIAVIQRINQCRTERSEPLLITGISINTGVLTAGGLGTADRLNYTVIGDTVNTVQRMQEATRVFGESGVVIAESTLSALKGERGDFRFEPLGEHAFTGKADLLWLYRLLPKDNNK